MKFNTALVAIVLLALAGVAHAGKVSLDLKDYDTDLMKDLDMTNKYFEPDIGGQNLDNIHDDAKVLLNGFQYTEQYFSKKGNYPDAVKWSKDGEADIQKAIQLSEAKDFDNAAAAARDATQNCKNCHDVYKPEQAR